MRDAAELIAQYGYPLYIYDEKRIAAQLARLRESLPDFRVLYSVKTNPHPAICRFMHDNGAGADAASAAEVELARAAGFPAHAIYYSAPAKTDQDLCTAFGSCVLTADSYRELERINALAAETGRVEPVGLRVNPSIAFGGGSAPIANGKRPLTWTA